jgi:hypothetical protein
MHLPTQFTDGQQKALIEKVSASEFNHEVVLLWVRGFDPMNKTISITRFRLIR